MTDFLRRPVQIAAVAVVALAWVADFISPSPDQQTVPVWISTLPGSAFAITGLIAWSLRPSNRVGLLLMAVGVGLLVGTTPSLISSPLADSIVRNLPGGSGGPWAAAYLALGPLWAVVLLHLLLAFPSGRLTLWVSRGLVGALYVLVPVIGLTYRTVPVSPVVIAVVYQACFAVSFVLIMKRWIQGGQARRRSLGPVLWSLAPLSVAYLIPTLLGVLEQSRTASNDALKGDLEVVWSLLLIVLPVGVLIGLLRSGLDMTSVASLVVKLSRGLLPDQLQPALAKVLHDPSLEVLYWIPSLEAYADLSGKRVDLPGPESERAASVLEGAEGSVAALVYDASLLHEPELVETTAAAVRMALQNAALQAELRAQLEEVRESRARLVEAGRQERQRVERDLHDGAQQQLVTLLLALQATKAEAIDHSDPTTAAMLDANIKALRDALAELRELARGIHPSILTEAGLMPALRSLAERCPIPVEINADAEGGRLAPHLEATLYFVAAEAITNAVKHSGSRRIRVSLQRKAKTIALDVRDDGHGGADVLTGSGLRGLSDRVAAVGGHLRVKSDEQRGTTVHSEIPCA